MHEHVVDRRAYGSRESLIVLERGCCTILPDHLFGDPIDLKRRYARLDDLGHLFVDSGNDAAGNVHQFDFPRRFD